MLDWNAECNLSQAQVKRVHRNGLLEIIGTERTIMKANGTPTVHDRLEETKLVQRLAEFLDVTLLHIQAWMGSESPNEHGQDRPSDAANSAQFDGQTPPDEMSEDKPTRSAENAQSITNSDSQTKQQNNDQVIQYNKHAAVVDAEREKKKEILQSLGKLGISYFKATQLVEKLGPRRVVEVITQAKDQNCKNVAGYIIRALQENWIFWSKPKNEDYACGDRNVYITGKYATFINH